MRIQSVGTGMCFIYIALKCNLRSELTTKLEPIELGIRWFSLIPLDNESDADTFVINSVGTWLCFMTSW